jgi:uncharacterized protein UPF0236
MQERIVLLGQMEVYTQASQSMENLLRVSVSPAQAYRITDTYGQLVSDDLLQSPETEPVVSTEVVYAEADGSMVFTDDGWQEVKVGRVFRSQDIRARAVEQNYIEKSQYAAHLGHYTDFTDKFLPLVEPYRHLDEQLVFLADGAKWFQNWVGKNFPKATLILDFYHATEHLAAVARLLINDFNERKRWFEQQKALLLNSQLPEVLIAIRKLRATTAEQVDEKQKLIRYYRQNEQRMDYKNYKEQGWHIGSGAIEAAHRTLVQDRMKKSGQRWSNEGARHMLNLRVASKSDRWHLVLNKLKYAA